MARVLVNAREPAHLTGPRRFRTFQVGDPVTVFEDGVEFGRDAEPATAPDDSPFVVLEPPGPRSDYLYLMMQHRGPFVLQTDPDDPEFGEEIALHIAKRKYQIDLTRLPTQAQAEWAQTRGQGQGKRRLPVGLTTRNAFEFAVRDKATGNPVDPTKLPRGKKA